ncbi:low temperature requirement protein A [Micromonospora purpureochromogenes]|uniref:Low temperature requirement protein LtrA n=1 Tax=Micromonospora purpureochromogenes TaxID=47872 RepID=A0ABX2RTN4_9ACTN|nr:low temperature requirement protein A [Micromonospora purpureochromogenes]NYF59900.1 low temperature requirement protein LtrA [Micromonospora purpureochromogenes]
MTRFELLFDLVYVFAVTRVTDYMADAHTLEGVAQGLLLLALLWWTWAGYAWLGNQARADQALLRAGMSVAMAALFVVDLTIPEAWHDKPGGLNGPLVLLAAYLVVRCVHLTVYSAAAAGDAGLRRQLAITWIPTLAGAALLLVGVLLGGWRQTVLFAVALLVDWGVVFITSRRGNWRVHSASHWSERHDLFVILAIGESILAIGIGAADQPISGPLLVAAVLGVAVAIGLWWLYFDLVAPAAEQRLEQARGQARTTLAVEAYSYAHFPIIAGIVLAALGVEGVLAHASGHGALGWFYAAALCGGAALYLGGHLLFKNRMGYGVHVGRLVTAAVLLGWLPAAAALPSLVALAVVVGILAALIAGETVRYADVRRALGRG